MGITAGIAVVSSVASAGFGAYSSIKKGEGQQAANNMQADKLQRAQEFGTLQANLTDTTMREQLNTTRGNIDTIRAAGNINPSSPTSAVIREHETMISDRQRTAALLNIRSQGDEDLASAAYLRKAGEFALTQGYLEAGAKVAGAVAKAKFPKGD